MIHYFPIRSTSSRNGCGQRPQLPPAVAARSISSAFGGANRLVRIARPGKLIGLTDEAIQPGARNHGKVTREYGKVGAHV